MTMTKTMAKKTKHILPWQVCDRHVVDCDGNTIAYNVSKQVAALIVDRVNNYESQVAALTEEEDRRWKLETEKLK